MSKWDMFTIIQNELVDDANLSDKAFRLAVLSRRYHAPGIGLTYEFIQEKTGWTPLEIAKAISDIESCGWHVNCVEGVE
jgi:hypothetical protein